MKYTEMNVEFTDWADGGQAIGKLPDGRIVFAKGVIPGETACVRFPTKGSRFVLAEVLKLCKTSELRIEPRCPIARICGHCCFQFVPYAEQLNAKTQCLTDALRRLGNFQNTENLMRSIVSADTEWEYRRNMVFYLDDSGKLSVLDRRGKPFALKTWCPICCDAINENLVSLEVEPESGLSSVEARAGDEDEIQFIFHGEADKPQNEIENDSEISLVYAGPESSYVMSGVSTIRQTIGDEILCISDSSDFFALPSAIEKVQESLGKLFPSEPFDLLQLNGRCGVFSRFFARKAKNLTVLSAEERETEDFIYNLDPFENVSLYIGPLAQSLAALPENSAEIVFADGGSAGFSAEELTFLCARNSPKITYFGTDPAIFARDASRICANGYILIQVIPFDPEPQTAEVWALGEFIRA